MSSFGENGIDAVVEWGEKVYFFDGPLYLRVSVAGDSGPGRLDRGFPRAIDPFWNFPDGFGANGIDAATVSRESTNEYLFFSGGRYIRVRRTGPTGPGRLLTPHPQSDERFLPPGPTGMNAAMRWGVEEAHFFRGTSYLASRYDPNRDYWSSTPRGGIRGSFPYWNGFGDTGIDDGLRWNNGPHVYIFKGAQYIKIYAAGANGTSSGDGANRNYILPGYPRAIKPHWNFPEL